MDPDKKQLSSRHITEQIIRPADGFAFSVPPESGGLVIFAGIVRDHSEGKKVRFLEYEAHVQLADQLIDEILDRAKQKWGLDHASCLHRVGRLNVGEVAILIVTTSAHRGEAFEANRYIIDSVKHEAPIWKRETFEDGTVQWSRGCVH